MGVGELIARTVSGINTTPRDVGFLALAVCAGAAACGPAAIAVFQAINPASATNNTTPRHATLHRFCMKTSPAISVELNHTPGDKVSSLGGRNALTVFAPSRPRKEQEILL